MSPTERGKLPQSAGPLQQRDKRYGVDIYCIRHPIEHLLSFSLLIFHSFIFLDLHKELLIAGHETLLEVLKVLEVEATV